MKVLSKYTKNQISKFNGLAGNDSGHILPFRQWTLFTIFLPKMYSSIKWAK